MDRAGEVKKKVVILEKYSPFHTAITGRSVRSLADFLFNAGIEVQTVSIDASYKGVKGSKMKLPYRVRELIGLYSGKNKPVRLFAGLLDGFRMVTYACMIKADVQIVLTNPPLLNMWAVLFKPFLRGRLVFWTMDLYPDAFYSARLVSEKNLLFRFVQSIVYGHAPDFMIVLGGQQYRYLSDKYKQEIPHVVLPCGINFIGKKGVIPWWREKYKDKIILCYAGNLGEAHDNRFLMELMGQLDPKKFMLLLVLYGVKAKEVLEMAKSRSGVEIVDYVTSNDLSYVDINIASLLSTWNNVCVPSKVVSAICAGTPVLYNASEDSEGYKMFLEALWLIPDDSDYHCMVSRFYKELSRETIDRKKQAALKYARQLSLVQDNAFQNILDYCKSDVKI